MSYATVTLTGKVTNPAGVPSRSPISVVTNVERIADAAGKTVLAGAVTVQPDSTGAFSMVLPATDDVSLSPSGFQYTINGPHGIDATFDLPAALGTIDLAQLVPVSPAPVSAASLTDATVKALVDNAASGTAGSLAKFRTRADATSWPLWVYGNSYSILAANYFTTGKHWTQLLAAKMGGGTVTSYGVSGKRILDVLSALLNQTAMPGLGTAPMAGSKWPGTSSRQGLVILECLINDFGHYPSMQGTAIPGALPSANTRYQDSLAALYRAALALMSSESRIEQSARTASSGTWTHDSNQLYPSGGTVSFTTAAGAYIEYSITPPQSGPLAGKVFLMGFSVDPGVGTMAQQTISVDGTVQTTRTPAAWEQYTGPGGVAVNVSVDVVAVTLPVDGAAHTIRLTHAGSAGQLLYSDCVLIPSIDPNPILIPGAEHTITAAPIWTAAQTAVYHQNVKTLTPVIKAVAAEFPNVFWAPSTMTTNGLYTADGIHPNDRGMAQRANDAYEAVQALTARLANRALRNQPDNTFAVI